jgi:hypothetical protein
MSFDDEWTKAQKKCQKENYDMLGDGVAQSEAGLLLKEIERRKGRKIPRDIGEKNFGEFWKNVDAEWQIDNSISVYANRESYAFTQVCWIFDVFGWGWTYEFEKRRIELVSHWKFLTDEQKKMLENEYDINDYQEVWDLLKEEGIE